MITTRTRLIACLSPKLFALTIASIAVVVIGCSKQSAPEPTLADPAITASEVVANSRDAMGELDSFKFELTHDSGNTALAGGLKLTRAGGVVSPVGLDLEAEANIGRAFVRVSAIVIDEKTWMTNPLTGTWSEIPPEESPFSFLDPVKLVADILGETQDPVYRETPGTGKELTVDGSIAATTLAALVGSVDPQAIPNVTLTVDPVSFFLKKIIINGVVQPEDDVGTVRVIHLSEFDKPVALAPPI
ncbi:MAG: LppX_LprAFG lipoprotein [Chloroflexi bacterium]|nr:LppX_LprAFG lipoprotein [Chloroflexota bacterium]